VCVCVRLQFVFTSPTQCFDLPACVCVCVCVWVWVGGSAWDCACERMCVRVCVCTCVCVCVLRCFACVCVQHNATQYNTMQNFATLRNILRHTGKKSDVSATPDRRDDTMQHNSMQHNSMQHTETTPTGETTQCNTTQCNTQRRHNATQLPGVSSLVRDDTLQHIVTHCNTLQHNATQCNTVQHNATHCNTMQHNATPCNYLQHTLQHTLQLSATRCNTPERRATFPQVPREAIMLESGEGIMAPRNLSLLPGVYWGVY